MNKIFNHLVSIFGFAVREYRENQLTDVSDRIFDPDLVTPYLSRILSVDGNVAQIMTRSLHCYGAIRSAGSLYVIGPVVRMRPDDVELKDLALELQIVSGDLSALRAYLDTLPILSLTKFSDILCLTNTILNGEDVHPEHILLGGDPPPPEQDADDTQLPPDASWNNYQTETKLMELVARGDLQRVEAYMMHTQFRQDFQIAGNSIRNLRNILIVSTTLATRAAIRGGMNPARAFDLSDQYIRAVENLDAPEKIYSLMARMVLDFTHRVGACVIPENVSAMIASCMRWIRRNISQPFTRADLAKYAGLSENYLSARFRREVGIPLSNYVVSQRVEAAKELLTGTDRSLADIASYFCFSSQSHFQNAFRRYAGVTPAVYRQQNRK
jgi:AraC-like DNA-binding protein